MRQSMRVVMLLWVVGGLVGYTPTRAAASAALATLSQQVAGGGVTVTATLSKNHVGATVVTVGLDTHSVSLDGYKFEEIVLLRDASGKTYPLEAVERVSGGGHHREAVLRFAKVAAEAKVIELIVKDVAGIKERTFHWSTAE